MGFSARAVFNLDGEQSDGRDYFSRGRPVLNHSGSSSQVSQYINLGGFLSLGGFSPEYWTCANSERKLNQNTLFKVTSYTEAMKSTLEETLSPNYPPLPGFLKVTVLKNI